ncbi:MAG: hypothetical protein ACRC1D_08035 [Culicoidibacterales bacterium]
MPSDAYVIMSTDRKSKSNDSGGHKQSPEHVVGSQIDARTIETMSDMTHSAMSEKGIRLIVQDGVKRKVFPHVKFYDKEEHDLFSFQKYTVCGIILNHCGVQHTPYAREWWARTKGLVHATHTLQRNNCIKALQSRFKSKCVFVVVVVLWNAVHSPFRSLSFTG